MVNTNHQTMDSMNRKSSTNRHSAAASPDSRRAIVVVLNQDGTILAINNPSEGFAARETARNTLDNTVGVDLFELTNLDDQLTLDQRNTLKNGIKAVLQGSRPEFTHEFDCHSSAHRRTYQLQVTPLFGMAKGTAAVVLIDVTAQRMIERQAENSEERFRLLLEGVQNYDIIMLDSSGVIRIWETTVNRQEAAKATSLIGHHISRIYSTDDMANGKPDRDLAETVAKGRIEHEGWRVQSDGTRYWAKLVSKSITDEEGRLEGFAIVLSDVTAQKQYDTALRSVVDHSTDAVITIDSNGIIQSFAGAAQKIFGYTASEVVGQKVNLLMPAPWRNEHDIYMNNYLRTRQAKIIGLGREVTGQRKDGSIVPLDLTVTEFALDNARFFTGILRDITERILAQEQLRIQATRDFLTGLWNRATVLSLLENELSRGQREGKPVGLLLIDVDHFKRINDTYGHQAGDAVLRNASDKMRAIIRPYATVGRYGGEEFLIVLPQCDEANVRVVCERLRTHLATTAVVYENSTIAFTVSVGAAITNSTVDTGVEMLIRAADLALYRAKTGGRNRFELATV